MHMRVLILSCVILSMCMSIASCVARERTLPSGVVRLRFVPDSPPHSPLESSKGAVWSGFAPGMFGGPGRLGLMAHAAIGDKFPVAHENGNQLFEVRLKDGNDDYVVLEILAENDPRELNIQRDKKKTLTIDGESYDFYYPSVEVAATENISTTNKAQIVITTRKH